MSNQPFTADHGSPEVRSGDVVDGYRRGQDPLLDLDVNEDTSSGQAVIIFARWVLIATALAITLWSPAQQDIDRVKVSLLVVLGLAVGNFVLHAHLLMGRQMRQEIIYAASAVDIGVITLINWAFGGLATSIFVFYYPALLGIALVFPIAVAAFFTLGLSVGYTLMVLPLALGADDLGTVVARVIAMFAVAVIGYMYRHIEHDRRSATARVQTHPDAGPHGL